LDPQAAPALMLELLVAWVLTELIEMAVGYALGVRRWREFAGIFLVNVFTNPALNYLFILNQSHFHVRVTWQLFFAAEAVVVVVEWVLLVFAFREKVAFWFLWSLLANFSSCLAGILLFGPPWD
jgi:hypothetical protein